MKYLLLLAHTLIFGGALGAQQMLPTVPQATDLPAAKKAPAVDFDFGYRDSLPQTDTPKEKWNTTWGPKAKVYPPLKIPDGVADPLDFQRKRSIAVAKKYLGLPYQHKHIPAAGGLDCSNFTSWVYNYGFGIKFTSNVREQARTAGRQLKPTEPFLPGDLLFQTDPSGKEIAHVVIFFEEGKIIDSTKGKVAVREYKGWYKTRHSHARRIIE